MHVLIRGNTEISHYKIISHDSVKNIVFQASKKRPSLHDKQDPDAPKIYADPLINRLIY
jgi:hypothetical protein